MYSQLVVIDFSKGKRKPDFEKISGHPTFTMAYCRCDAFDHFHAFLYNYERLDNRPLCELVFMFDGPFRPTEKAEYDTTVCELMQGIDKAYRERAEVNLVTVTNHPQTTVCTYVPTMDLPTIGETLEWLSLKPTVESANGQPPCGEDAQSPPPAPAVPGGESAVDQ